jgi:predicted nucleotide-binding protein
MDVAADAAFAIVLMSPDDEARTRGADEQLLRPRARQNVVFELGLFLGLLGRTKVVALHQAEDGFEMPSDYQGVLFVPFDNRGAWKLELAREMKAAGFGIDLNKLT